MTTTPELDVSGLSVSYGKVRALDDVTLQVGRGQIVTLLGSNGAGKSTLLNALTGVVPKKAGAVHLNGTDVTKANPWDLVEQGMAHVPEGRQIFPNLTIEQHLRLSERPAKSDRHEFSAGDVFELFPRLNERRNVLVGNLSGGEQQMVAVGRALVTQPRLLLLDEPSLGLAPKLAQSVIATIGSLREAGLSVLLVEQNATLALGVADRVYVLANGRIAAEGTAEAMRNSDEVRRAYLGGDQTSGTQNEPPRREHHEG
jgi:branched-chain amino acid transport system ATP-binding protein